MTTTAAGIALVERHRLVQGALAKTTAAQMLRLWPLLVAGGRVDANTSRWLELAAVLMAGQRARSAATAAQFSVAYRAAELGTVDGFSLPEPKLELNLDAVRTSLAVLGPVAYKREVARQVGREPRDLTPRDLLENRLSPGISQKLAANTARAAMRHVQNGARETLDEVMKTDAAVIGYVRTTSPTPCWFCAMLASRGPVYSDDSFADSDPRFHGPGDQKVHDGCGCMLLPMYRRAGEKPPGRSAEFNDLWRKTGNRLDFRRAYEGRSA